MKAACTTRRADILIIAYRVCTCMLHTELVTSILYAAYLFSLPSFVAYLLFFLFASSTDLGIEIRLWLCHRQPRRTLSSRFHVTVSVSHREHGPCTFERQLSESEPFTMRKGLHPSATSAARLQNTTKYIGTCKLHVLDSAPKSKPLLFLLVL